MALQGKTPSPRRLAWDDFLINKAGSAIIVGLGAAATLGAGGPLLLALAGGLTLMTAMQRRNIDVPAMIAEQDKTRRVPYYHPVSELVKRLAKEAGLEKAPACLFLNDDRIPLEKRGLIPFAGTVGTSASSVIIVSRGIENELSPVELEAVLAHEIAHVKNADSKRMMSQQGLAQMAGMAMMYALITTVLAFAGFGPPLGMAQALIAAGGALATTATVAAVSRAMERRADRESAALTKNPWALASALGRIVELKVDMFRRMDKARPGPFARMLGRVFSTHPATRSRRQTLDAIGDEMIAQNPALAEVKRATAQEITAFEQVMNAPGP